MFYKEMQSSFLYGFMVQGILDADIPEDGGELCYNEIPKISHFLATVIGIIVNASFLNKWASQLSNKNDDQRKNLQSNWAEKLLAFTGIVTLALTFYYKMIMRKGLFIFNPCHLSCLGVIVMCLKSSTSTMRTFHTMWTSWIFGAALALSVPHLNGVSEVEIYLYYLEHYLIVPIGPVILYRRYGFLQPTVKNQLAAFSSMVCYQLSILFILSITTKVNLNFVLCHSPGDPFYPYLGHWYFPFSVYYLNFASWLFRYFLFIFLSPLKLFWKNPESEPIKPSSNSLSIDM